MGKGCALEACKLFPGLALALGNRIKLHGNRALIIQQTERWPLVAFPVKAVAEQCDGTNVVRHMALKFAMNETVPGWACKARLEIIHKSAHELSAMADKFGWQRVILPRPGCGAGELTWHEVEPVLQAVLDDRFHSITFR